MKQKIKYFLISVLAISLIINHCYLMSAQVQTGKFDLNEKVYWFYLNVSIKNDKILNRDVYVIRISSQKPKYDTYSVYEKDIWRCLKAGHQIVVGPFREFDAAKQAIKIYDLCKLQENERDTEVIKMEDSANVSNDEYFCYFMKFYISERTKSIKLKRIPARTSVVGITVTDFIDQFLEGVTQQMLTIGPFRNKEEAEDSKRINRLEE